MEKKPSIGGTTEGGENTSLWCRLHSRAAEPVITGITLGGAVTERLNNFRYVKIQNLLFVDSVDSAQALWASFCFR